MVKHGKWPTCKKRSMKKMTRPETSTPQIQSFVQGKWDTQKKRARFCTYKNDDSLHSQRPSTALSSLPSRR